MTCPAQGHQVFNRVFSVGAAHASGADVMDVDSSGAANLTGVEVRPAKMIYIDLGVLLHLPLAARIAIASICSRERGLPLAPRSLPFFLLSAISSRMLDEMAFLTPSLPFPFFSGICFYFTFLLEHFLGWLLSRSGIFPDVVPKTAAGVGAILSFHHFHRRKLFCGLDELLKNRVWILYLIT